MYGEIKAIIDGEIRYIEILNIDYEISGKYRPPTLEEPPEFPEIIIKNIEIEFSELLFMGFDHYKEFKISYLDLDLDVGEGFTYNDILTVESMGITSNKNIILEV